MARRQPVSGIIGALIACLSIGMLLLGLELSLTLTDSDRLPWPATGVLSVAMAGLYAALSWRGCRGQGSGMFVRWWATMLVAHAAMGMTIGVAHAAATGTALDGVEIAQWASATSLPLLVLQAGYGIGIAALAWGDEILVTPTAERTEEATAPATASALGATPPEPQPAEPTQGEEAAYLEVYTKAIERLRAPDHETLVRFAMQAANCEGGLIATRDGLVVAAAASENLDTGRVAAVLPELMRDLEKLTGKDSRTPVMLHAAFGSLELLAVPGAKLTACLIGRAGSREVAEVVLPVLVTRAEELRLPGPSGTTASRSEMSEDDERGGLP